MTTTLFETKIAVTNFRIPYSAEFGGTTVGAYPFTGNGFTLALDGQIIPEFRCSGYLEVNDGAQLIAIRKDGSGIVRAIYSQALHKFVQVE